MRKIAVLIFAVLVIVPSGASVGPAILGTDDPAAVARSLAATLHPTAAGALEEALAARDDAESLARGLHEAADGAEMLERLAAAQGVALPPRAGTPSAARLSEALVELAAVANVALSEDDLARFEAAESTMGPQIAAATADLVTATRDAALTTQRALAGLDADEVPELRTLLQAFATRAPMSERDMARFGALASRVDVAPMAEGARDLLAATSRATTALSVHTASSFGPPVILSCAPGYIAPDIFDFPPLLAIGSGVQNCYQSDYMVSLDLGGDDIYINNAGASVWLLAAVALDLGGDDRYHSEGFVPAGAFSLYGVQGTGTGGIGVLVDVRGNDLYASSFGRNLVTGSCDDYLSTYEVSGLQGAGLVGVGALVDAGGFNQFSSYNCLGYDVVVSEMDVQFSQGSGVYGLGLFAVTGPGGSAVNSFNTFINPDVGLRFHVAQSQGAGALIGAGAAVVATQYGAHYNSRNTFIADSPVEVLIECVQGRGGLCPRVAPPVTLLPPPPVAVDLGVIAGTGIITGDEYNCFNVIDGGGNLFTVVRAQGNGGVSSSVTPISRGHGVMFDPLGDDCYNSWNSMAGGDEPSALFSEVQGASTGGIGILIDAGGRDDYNSFNVVTGGIVTMTISVAQGAGVGEHSVGVLVDTSLGTGDAFNSFNILWSALAVGPTLEILRVQGAAITFLPREVATGVILHVGTLTGGGTPTRWNSDNFAYGSGAFDVSVAQGAAQAFALGSVALGLMVSLADSDAYNVANGFSTSSVNSVHAAVPALPAFAVFADVGLVGDAYAPSFTGGSYCAFPLVSLFVDAWDGADVPVGLPIPCADF